MKARFIWVSEGLHAAAEAHAREQGEARKTAIQGLLQGDPDPWAHRNRHYKREPGNFAVVLARHILEHAYCYCAPCGQPYVACQPILTRHELREHMIRWFGPDIPEALARAGEVLQVLHSIGRRW